MKFIDEAIIHVKAGDGGPGASHFRREKFVPYGGPDGGNGGRGGSIILKATKDKNTLLDYSFKREWQAPKGQAGAKQLKDGADGEDVILYVPVGTEVYNALNPEDENELVVDLDTDGMEHTIVHGGKGGKGNTFFKSATKQAPEYAQPGLEGEQGSFRLSLKLLADVGLVGLPNAGKSTFISVVSAAKPKIADYPFTTLTPNLGVVKGKGNNSYTVADVPGLIEGAHEGKGLGKDFLKHLERTKILLHLIDVSELDMESPVSDPKESYKVIENELRGFSDELGGRESAIVLTKIDSVTNKEALKQLIESFKELGKPCFALSSVTREGLQDCLDYLDDRLQKATCLD